MGTRPPTGLVSSTISGQIVNSILSNPSISLVNPVNSSGVVSAAERARIAGASQIEQDLAARGIPSSGSGGSGSSTIIVTPRDKPSDLTKTAAKSGDPVAQYSVQQYTALQDAKLQEDLTSFAAIPSKIAALPGDAAEALKEVFTVVEEKTVTITDGAIKANSLNSKVIIIAIVIILALVLVAVGAGATMVLRR